MMQNFLNIFRSMNFLILIALLIIFAAELRGQSLTRSVNLALKSKQILKNQKILLDNSLQNLNIQKYQSSRLLKEIFHY